MDHSTPSEIAGKKEGGVLDLPESTCEARFCRTTGLDPRTVAQTRRAELEPLGEAIKKGGRWLLTAIGVLRLAELLKLPDETLEALCRPEEPRAFWVVKLPFNRHLLRVRTEKNGGEELMVRCRDNSTFRVGAEIRAQEDGWGIWRVLKKKGERR